ncbi:MAG TPA: sigma-70 family RNA polymerase sigma factor, partial [Candidatus Polarisedimenticolia bacterium]
MSEIRDYPVMTVERERAMAKRGPGAVDPTHRDELVTSSLGFVVRVALEFKGCGLPLEDLLNEGNLGLIEAARHYDPSRGTRFITCAVWWIRKSILKALAGHASLVQVPSCQLRNLKRVRAAAQGLAVSLGRSAGRQELSSALGVSPAKIDSILQMKMRELSLDEKIGTDSEDRLLDRLVDDRAPSPEAVAIARDRETLVRRMLPHL